MFPRFANWSDAQLECCALRLTIPRSTLITHWPDALIGRPCYFFVGSHRTAGPAPPNCVTINPAGAELLRRFRKVLVTCCSKICLGNSIRPTYPDYVDDSTSHLSRKVDGMINQRESIRRWQLLLITDDAFTIDAAHGALHIDEFPIELTVEREAVSALNRMRGCWSSGASPELIMIDLHLEGLHGFEMLSEFRSSARLTGVPIVMLTDTEEEESVLSNYELEDISYACRPYNTKEFATLIAELATYLDAMTWKAKQHQWQSSVEDELILSMDKYLY